MRALLLPLALFSPAALADAVLNTAEMTRICVGNYGGSDLQWSIFQGDEGNPSFAADVPNHPANATNHGYMCVQTNYLGGTYTLRLRSADPMFSCAFSNVAAGQVVEVTPPEDSQGTATCTLLAADNSLVAKTAASYSDLLVPSPFGDQANQIQGQVLEVNSGGLKGQDGTDMRDGANGTDGSNLAQGAQGECAGANGEDGEKGGAAGAGQNAGGIYVKADVVPGTATSSGLTLSLSGWREDPTTLEKTALPATQVPILFGQYVLLRAQGGDGGNGGRAGNGGNGGNAGTAYDRDGQLRYCAPGSGGNGGQGGYPGPSGAGGYVYLDLPSAVANVADLFYVAIGPGMPGAPGLPGKGGQGGRVGTNPPSANQKGQDGDYLRNGFAESGRLDLRYH